MRGVALFWEKENFGKLSIRIVLGLLFVALGVRHFAGGLSALRILGAIFGNIGITFWPGLWGTFSAVILILSGMCYLIGFFYRSNCALLLCIFSLQLVLNWKLDKGFLDYEFLFNTLVAINLFSGIFTGAGRFSSDGH